MRGGSGPRERALMPRKTLPRKLAAEPRSRRSICLVEQPYCKWDGRQQANNREGKAGGTTLTIIQFRTDQERDSRAERRAWIASNPSPVISRLFPL
jgi:hypothetical protein